MPVESHPFVSLHAVHVGEGTCGSEFDVGAAVGAFVNAAIGAAVVAVLEIGAEVGTLVAVTPCAAAAHSVAQSNEGRVSQPTSLAFTGAHSPGVGVGAHPQSQ